MRPTAEQRRAALKKRGTETKRLLDYSKSGIDGDIKKYQMKAGKDKNYIDILPFEITQPWYKDLRGISGKPIGLDVGYTDYKLEIPVHKGVGDPILCLRLAFGKKCAICDDMFEAYKEETRDQKKISSLKPSWRCYYNVYDYNSGTEDIYLWEDVSWYLFEQMLKEASEDPSYDDGVPPFSDLEIGSSLQFHGREKKIGDKGKPFIEAQTVVFEKRDPWPDEVLDTTYSLDAMLTVPTYEQVTASYLGLSAPGTNDTPSEEATAETPAKEAEAEKPTGDRKRFRGKRSAVKEQTETEEMEAEPEGDKCPHGGVFGKDCDTLNECEECDEVVFQTCADKQDSLKKAEKAQGRRPGRRNRNEEGDDDIPF